MDFHYQAIDFYKNNFLLYNDLKKQMKQHHKIMIFSYSELEHMFNHSKDTHAMYYYDINNIKEISKLCIQTCDARVIYTLTKQIRKMKSKDENINKKYY